MCAHVHVSCGAEDGNWGEDSTLPLSNTSVGFVLSLRNPAHPGALHGVQAADRSWGGSLDECI